MAVVRDEEYAVVVERERPLLQACAYLLTADAERADRLVQLVLGPAVRALGRRTPAAGRGAPLAGADLAARPAVCPGTPVRGSS